RRHHGAGRAAVRCSRGAVSRWGRALKAMRLVAATSLCVMLAAAASLAAASQSFSSKVEAVRLDVLVTENGRPVRGLQAGDFDVLDNGVPQPVDLVSYEDIPLNVILAFDMSESLDQTSLDHLRNAGKTLLDGLNRDDHAALVTFSHVVAQRAPLTSDFDRVRAALDDAAPSGHTSLVDASF